MCLKYPEKFAGLVLIAPGVNFVQRYLKKIAEVFPENVLELLEKGETLDLAHPEYGTFPISYDLFNDMTQYDLKFSPKLDVFCPVRIIHGMKVRRCFFASIFSC